MVEWLVVGVVVIISIRYSTLLNGYLAFDRQANIKTLHTIPVTVVIAIKNEERHLPQLFESLLGQTYDLHHVQFIFVDDHSTDNSSEIIQSFISNFPNAEYVLNVSNSKKQAILTGVCEAKYDWILMTDADCIPSSNWIEFMMCSISDISSFIAGPVQLNVPSTWYGNLLTNEHAALQQLTRLSIAKQEPLMANGANMLFKKDLVDNAFTPNTLSYDSGDDSNLLFSAWKQNSQSIVFANSLEATVVTNSPDTLSDTIKQRVRWASKLKQYESLHHVTSVGWIIAISNLTIPLLLILSFKGMSIGITLLGYVLFKTLVDQRFTKDLIQNHSFTKQLISTLLYPFFFGSILTMSLLNDPKKSATHSQKW
jgi:glycosyltransferase involved in cell wall biosynthesis